MRLTALALAAALTLAVAVPLAAQEEEESAPAEILMVSSYICPQSAIGDIAEGYERYNKPLELELVDEGVFAGAGLFFHFWADEWNVNYYRTGYDLEDMLAGVQTVNQRVVELNPELEDQPGPFEACSAHKDNIYTFGPGTARPDMTTESGGN